MNTTSPAIGDLARRLIASEAAREPSDGPVGATVRACDRMRVPLAKLVGVAGFRSLLSRALAMAKAEAPALDGVRVRPDGSLEGLDASERTMNEEAGVLVVARLLGLLVTFIGEPLTLLLVRDAWPDATVDGIDAGSGEAS
jgi:hypothetical protein